MSDFLVGKLMSEAKSFLFGEEQEVERNLKVGLVDEDATEINGDTQLRVQDGSKPARQVSVRDYVGAPDQDSKFQGMGDPSTRLKNLLTDHQVRHRSNEAKEDGQGILVEPNGAMVVPFQRLKVNVDVERSKVRVGDKVLAADNGAILVPTGQEHL